MIPVSCTNCCFNGLQDASLGLRTGYCVEHRVALPIADATTCPRLLRKDLGAESQRVASEHHRRRVREDRVQWIRGGTGFRGERQPASGDTKELERDPVGALVLDYGLLDDGFASLALLERLEGSRAELAYLSLGRAYMAAPDARWTRGVHLLWWLSQRLGNRPEVLREDARDPGGEPTGRDVELAAWSLVVLRLQLAADIGRLASWWEPVRALEAWPELAAEATEEPSLDRLLGWIRDYAQPVLAKALPRERYLAIRAAVAQERRHQPERTRSDPRLGAPAPALGRRSESRSDPFHRASRPGGLH